MPAIHDGDAVVARAAPARRGGAAARRAGARHRAVPGQGLGPTVAPLAGYPRATLAKTSFSAAADPGFAGAAARRDPRGRHRAAARRTSACCRPPSTCSARGSGSSSPPTRPGPATRPTKAAAVERARQHGVEVVTSEMVLFEWLRDAQPPAVPRGAAAAALEPHHCQGAARFARGHRAATRLAAMAALHRQVPEDESGTELDINPVYFREKSCEIPGTGCRSTACCRAPRCRSSGTSSSSTATPG